jgi:hypothetical protein
VELVEASPDRLGHCVQGVLAGAIGAIVEDRLELGAELDEQGAQALEAAYQGFACHGADLLFGRPAIVIRSRPLDDQLGFYSG